MAESILLCPVKRPLKRAGGKVAQMRHKCGTNAAYTAKNKTKREKYIVPLLST